MTERDESAFTATAIAAAVRSGKRSPVDVVQFALDRIAERDPKVGAFVSVRAEQALAEARDLAARDDLEQLPLAGVPIAIKDNVAVAGLPNRDGSLASDPAPAAADHLVVQRLRAAGAIVVGVTAMPELGLWGTTDSPGSITRNPWNLERTAGGSSGGAAAAVAAGMIPVAHGNDGLGSVRGPAASCGIVGIKPGRGVVPADVGVNDWYGMCENGPLATTVADTALLLAVMADRPQLAELGEPRKLRIGLAVGTPSPIVRVDRHWTAAARTAGSTLVNAGHLVETAVLPYPKSPVGEFARWTASAAVDADDFDFAKLQRRSRPHVRIGRVVRRLGLVRDQHADRLRERLGEFFEGFDLVLTPTLADSPPRASAWSEKSWLSNVVVNVRYAPFPALWNVSGWPAASVPVGIHPVSGSPLGVQIAGPPGSEATILAVAGQIEERRPWTTVVTP